MKFYKIYENDIGHIEVVKMGWSWPAFFFGFIWALVKKLWTIAGILIAYHLVIALIYSIIWDSFILMLQLLYAGDLVHFNLSSGSFILLTVVNIVFQAVPFILGAKGNDFREQNLQQKGYQMTGTLMAIDAKQALFNAIDKKEKNSNQQSTTISL